MIGFVVWSAVAGVLVGVAVWCWRSRKAVSFFAGVGPSKVRDVRRYNRAVAKLWLGYALVFELLGVPLLFAARNKALIAVTLLGVPVSVITLAAAYHVILRKAEKPSDEGDA